MFEYEKSAFSFHRLFMQYREKERLEQERIETENSLKILGSCSLNTTNNEKENKDIKGNCDCVVNIDVANTYPKCQFQEYDPNLISDFIYEKDNKEYKFCKLHAPMDARYCGYEESKVNRIKQEIYQAFPNSSEPSIFAEDDFGIYLHQYIKYRSEKGMGWNINLNYTIFPCDFRLLALTQNFRNTQYNDIHNLYNVNTVSKKTQYLTFELKNTEFHGSFEIENIKSKCVSYHLHNANLDSGLNINNVDFYVLSIEDSTLEHINISDSNISEQCCIQAAKFSDLTIKNSNIECDLTLVNCSYRQNIGYGDIAIHAGIEGALICRSLKNFRNLNIANSTIAKKVDLSECIIAESVDFAIERGAEEEQKQIQDFDISGLQLGYRFRDWQKMEKYYPDTSKVSLENRVFKGDMNCNNITIDGVFDIRNCTLSEKFILSGDFYNHDINLKPAFFALQKKSEDMGNFDMVYLFQKEIAEINRKSLWRSIKNVDGSFDDIIHWVFLSLFRTFSGYNNILYKPLLWMILSFLVFSCTYYTLFPVDWQEAVKISVSNSFPILSDSIFFSETIRNELQNELWLQITIIIQRIIHLSLFALLILTIKKKIGLRKSF